MKNPRRQTTWNLPGNHPARKALFVPAILLVLSATPSAQAANGVDTWNSAGTSVSWGGTGSSGNWTGANTPPVTGDSLTFDVDSSAGGATTPVADSLIDNLTIGGTNSWTFANITFTANAPAYTIAPGTAAGQGPGAGFTLGTATAATVINEYSGNIQTINDVIKLGAANQSFSLSAGGLSLYGLIYGSGGIVLNPNGESGVLTLSNATTTLGEFYTGPTIVGGGQLNLGPFLNTGTNGIGHSSMLIISNNATVTTFSDNALAGSSIAVGSLPVTINAGGTLTSASGSDAGAGTSVHIRGVLTLNGGTLACGGTGNQAATGTWDLDDGVVVPSTAPQTSTISAPDVELSQSGGTVFNVASTGNTPDLDVSGSFIHGATDTGLNKQGAGTMNLDGVNTYTGATIISAGTLNIMSGGLLGGATGIYGGTISNNGTLNYNGSAAETFNGVFRGTGAFNINDGTVTLSAANTYSGPTTVASGANLTVVAGGTSLSAITLNGGTIFSVNVPTVGGQWNLTNNLTFVDSAPVLVLNFSNTLSTTVAPLRITGNVNFATTLSLVVNGNALIPTGTYPLITWTGTASGTAPTTANANVTVNLVGVTGTIQQSGNAINLVVSSGTAPLTWNTGSGTWDTTSPNWLGGTTYKDGDAVTFPDTAASSPITVTLNSTVAPSAVTFTNATKNYILSGSGHINGPSGLTLSGTGKLAIQTANTYTGPTLITNGGTVTLDFTGGAAAPIISAASSVSLGNATLNVLGSASSANDQPFVSTAIQSGPNVINASGAQIPEVDLGALTDSAGASVVLNGPATITNVDGVTVTPASATITTTTAGAVTSAAQEGFLQAGGNNTIGACGYVTVGLYDWASTSLADGTPGSAPYTILGGSMVAGFYTPFSNVGTTNANGTQVNGATPSFGPPAGTTVQEVNWDITNNTYVAGYGASRLVMGSMRFNTPLPIDVWFGWGQGTGNGNPNNIGGFLVTPNVGANNITLDDHQKGGLNGSTGTPRTIVWQNNTLGELIFDQSLGANGPPTYPAQFIVGAGYEQNGPGTVSFLGINGYTVGTFLNGGVLEIAQENSLGGIAVGQAVGATNAPVYLDGGTLLANFTGNLDDGTSTAIHEHPLAVGIKGGGVAATAGNTFTVDGVITNISGLAGPLVIGIPASSANGNANGLVPGTGSGTANPTPVYATGTVVVSNPANAYTGGTVIDSGTLQLNLNNLAVFGAGGITLNGGTFQWLNGITTDISGKALAIAAGNGTLDVNSGAGSANSVTLANGIGGSGALTVASSTPGGKLTLAGANTYAGGTTVNPNSTLLINGSLGSGPVTNNGTLGGTGTIGGNAVWNPGSIASLTAGSPLTVAGTVTLSGNTVNVVGSSLTPAGSPYTLLTAAGGFTGGSAVNGSPGGNAVAAGNLGVVSISGHNLILTITTLPSATWTDGNNSGNWSDPLDWSATFGTTPPSGAQATAIFGTGVSPVNLDVNETVGTLGFTSPSIPYTIAGSHTLTLDASGHGAAISLAVGTANATIATPISLNDSLTASVSGGSTLTLSNAISSTSSSKTITFNGAGKTVLAGANTFGPAAGTVGTTLTGGGTLQVANNNALGAGDLSASGNSTIQAGAAVSLANNLSLGAGTTTVDNNGTNLTLNGVISGGGNLTKVSNHTLTLGANNTYSGGTAVNGGFLAIAAEGASGGSSGSLGVVPSLVSAANVTLNNGGLLDTATLALNANRGLTLTGTGWLDAASGATFTVNGIVTGNNGLTVNSGAGDTGTVVLSAANTFTGTTTVAGGVLQLANAVALQDSTLNLNGGSLDFSTLTNATVGGLSGSQNLNLINDTPAAVTLTVGFNNVSAVYSGILGGTGSVDKLGSGTITIGSGANGGASYTGATRVDGGTLILGGIGNLNATGTLDISGVSPGNVIVQDSAIASFAGGILLGDGNSAPAVTGLQIMNHAQLSAASLSVGNDIGRVPAGTFVEVQDNGALTIPGSFDLNDAFSTTANSNSLVLAGQSVVTLGNILATTGSAAHLSVINFNGGMLVAATNDPAGSAFLPALTGLTVLLTNVPAFINSANFTITVAANLTSSGSDAGVVKLGPGTLVLSGANTYSGMTTVSNGTLLVSGALNNSGENFAVNDGKAFGAYYNGTTPQVGSVTLGQSSGASLVFSNLSSITAAALHADFVNLNGSCTLRIADAVNLTAPNEYPLVQVGGLIVTNSGAGFSLVLPGGVTATLTNDPGIIPGYTTLALKVAGIVPYTPPSTISSLAVSGNSLVVNATGGTAGATVNVLTSTNLTLPLSQWTTNSTTTYDGNGNLVNYAIPGAVSPGQPQQFYRLQQP